MRLLAPVELSVVEMANDSLTSSHFAQEVTLCDLPILSMTLPFQGLSLLCLFLSVKLKKNYTIVH